MYPDLTDSTETMDVSKLRALTLPGYGNSHLFYVDLTPFSREIYDSRTGETRIMLVGGLGKGGRGYYALNVTDAVNITAASGEAAVKDMILWEYPHPELDGVDNDADDSVDEDGETYLPGQTDPDMGYAYSKAFVVKTNYHPVEGRPQWVVIFGNGYNSDNGEAVLYVVFLDDSDLSITDVMKIRTGPVGTGCNGLSTPLLADTDGDFKLDYVYAGDLLGNLWKFDFTAADPAEWKVAFFDNDDVPQPLFRATAQDRAETSPCGPTGTAYTQAITTKPTAMHHCRSPKKHGYIVVFGTGRYLGDEDLDPALFKTETIYGIWDYGDDEDDSEYLGAFDRETGRLSNFDVTDKVTLLKQVQIDWRTVPGHDLRTLSDNEPNWATIADPDTADSQNPSEWQHPDPNGNGSGFGNDGVDNDGDGSTDEEDERVAHVGWYFDLPGFGPFTCPPDSTVVKGERVVKDYVIRDGAAIIMSIVPSTDRCSGGGDTMVHEIDACSGGRTADARFDINDDNEVTTEDYITVGGESIPPSGITYPGILHPPVVVDLPGKPVEMKVFSTSAGETVTLTEVEERRGIYYWRDIR